MREQSLALPRPLFEPHSASWFATPTKSLQLLLIGAALAAAVPQVRAEPTAMALALKCEKLGRYLETKQLPANEDDVVDIAICNAMASAARETAFAAWKAYTGKKCDVGGMDSDVVATAFVDFIRQTSRASNMKASEVLGTFANSFVKMFCEKAAAR